jgi:RNA polymerase sigma factor (sigma-70 family)
MGARPADGIIQTLCKLAEPYGQLTDGQLLERFAAHRDERAFAELLKRHGGLVYAVCRNILRHEHDAEDAFQGTFLVLARRAGAIQEAKAVGSWLYRVAYRVAMKARQAAERRREHEGRVARPIEGDRAGGELAWRELQSMLDEELGRLPDKYRTPFLLCCLLGKSKSEAAAELGWKTGTVSSRLAHARKLLQTRLARRGVTLSALLSGLAITERNSTAAIPAGLLEKTCRAAVDFVSGTAPTAAASSSAELAQSVLRGMGVWRLKVAAVVAVVFGLLGTAAVAVTQPPSPNPPVPPDASSTDRAPAALFKRAEAGAVQPPPGKLMTVGGSVLGVDGRPIAGSRVAVVAYRYPNPREMAGSDRYDHVLLGEGVADEQGNYRLTVPQTTAWNYRLTVVAGAPGYALGSRAADPTTTTHSDHTIPVQLVRGHAVRVQFADPEGRPVTGASVNVAGMSRNGPAGLLMIRYGAESRLPGWPEPTITDSDGCITLRDVGPETDVLLHVHDERFAPDWHRFRTGAEESPDPVRLPLASARVLEGRVLAEDTHMPIAGAVVVAETKTLEHNYLCIVSARADRDGRYRLNPFRGSRIGVRVYPPDDVPYLVPHVEFPWSDNAPTPTRDIFVPRGILVRGVVREAESGRPVPGASVSHEWSHENNPFMQAARAAHLTPWPTRGVLTRPDGSYSITVPPGPGFLLVKSPEPDFIHVETGSGRLDGSRGGTPHFLHAVEPLRLAPAAPPVECPIVLRRGITLRGRVVGHDGSPVASGVALSPTYIPEGTQLKGHPLPVQNGRFEIPGLEPNSSMPVVFLDRQKKEGAVAVLSARSGVEPEIRLAPCVSSRVRIAGPAAKGAARISTELVFRPGPTANETFDTGEIAELAVGTDRILGADGRATKDKSGDFLLPNLIPGALYTVRVDVPGFSPERIALRAPVAASIEQAVIVVEPKKPEEPKKK